MAGILKRLSLQVERSGRSAAAGEDFGSAASSLATAPSFNDFSMHIGQEVEHEAAQPAAHAMAASTMSTDSSHSAVFGSAPTGSFFGPTRPPGLKTGALRIPRTSVAHILQRAEPAGETPRSSLDVAGSCSVPTPRALLDSAPGSPRSPTSPMSPSGRRTKRSHKIEGLDYEVFRELIRSSSL